MMPDHYEPGDNMKKAIIIIEMRIIAMDKSL